MVSNSYLLDLDLKHKMITDSPVFRRGDTAIMKFRVHDDGIVNDINDFDRAEITLVMPSKMQLRDVCKIEKLDNVNIAVFQFQKIHMVEVGIYKVMLTLFKGEDKVSPPPFSVRIEDNVSDSDYEFLDIINDLDKSLDILRDKLNNGIPIETINKQNGVAGLDAYKKIPKEILPEYFEEHIATSMYKDGAHGFKIDENGKYWVLIKGNYEEAFISEFPMGGGVTPHEPPTISIDNGTATVKFKDELDIILMKWDKGVRNIEYFLDKGHVISNNQFTVNEIGDHTLYYKLSSGEEYVVVFQATLQDLITDDRPKIEDVENGKTIIFGDTEWLVLDNKKGMLITKSSMNRSTFNGQGNEPFNPQNINSTVANWLNHTFNERFTSGEWSRIVEKEWLTSSELNMSQTKVTAKIGLINLSELDIYKDVISKSLSSTDEYFSITEDSSSKDNEGRYSNIWNIINVDGNQSISSVSKQTYESGVKPVIYLQLGTKVDVYEEDENVPFNQFNNGDIIKFSNMKWIVVDKDKRLISYYDDVIMRDREDISKWLSNDFYYSLTSQAKRFIELSKYNVQYLDASGTYLDRYINSYITLPSVSMWNIYKNTTMKLYDESQLFHTSTYVDVSGEPNLICNPNVSTAFGELVRFYDGQFMTIPVLTLTSNATVGSIKKVNKKLHECKVGEEFNFGGFTWLTGVDNYAIMKGRFKYDSGKKWVYPFTNNLSNAGFVNLNKADSNISTMLNEQFINNWLYKRAQSKLQIMQLQTGFYNSESTTSGLFKVGLLSNAMWIDNYSKSLYDNLIVTEDFWLLNWYNASEAVFVDSKTGETKRGNPTKDSKLVKPVIKLSPDEDVEIYEKNDVFAYVPDPELRKNINLLLGKGRGNDGQITLEEMKKINHFDSISLGRVSDLTGIELMTNCTYIRVAPYEVYTNQPDFKFSNVDPIIALGKSANLISLFFYAVDNNNSHNMSILNKLKAQFPLIKEGGVYNNGFEDCYISCAELKGIPEGLFVDNARSVSVDNDSGMYVPYFTVRAYGKKPITKIKRWNDADWIDLEGAYRTLTIGLSDEDDFVSSPSGTDSKTYRFSFMDGDGNTETVVYRLDDSFVYVWTENENKVSIISARAKGYNSTSLTLPKVIDGKTIYSVGGEGTEFMAQAPVKSLFIPENYKEIWSVFKFSDISDVSCFNDNILFKAKEEAFKKRSASKDILTFKGRQNSTIHDFYNFKVGSENNESDFTKSLYKFEIIQ